MESATKRSETGGFAVLLRAKIGGVWDMSIIVTDLAWPGATWNAYIARYLSASGPVSMVPRAISSIQPTLVLLSGPLYGQ
jgi:hypothetical protein